MRELPSSWTYISLGETGNWRGGGTPSKDVPEFWEKGEVPWVSPKDMKTARIRDSEDHITDRAIVESATKRVPEGSVLIVTRSGILAHTLPVAVTDVEVTVNQDLKALTPSEFIDVDFVAWALRAFGHDILEKCKKDGTTVASIEFEALSRYQMPLAPCKEQRRIVDAIDSYITRLDNAVASLERVQNKLQAYRGSVIKAAVEGRLVPTEASLARAEKREYEPAEVLLARILRERRLNWQEGELAKLKRTGKAPSDGKLKAKNEEPIAPQTRGLPVLPEGWCWATVDQVAKDTMIGLVRNRQQQRKRPPGYAYLKMDAIGLNGSLRMDQFVYVDADKADAERCALRANDILFNTRNSIELVGKTALVPGGASGRLFNNNIMRIRVWNGLAPAFIALQMSSLPFRARLEKIKRATTNVAAIYGKDLFPQVLAIPPAAEQDRITEIVASLLSTQEAVNDTIVSQLKRTERLRQSILKWAFEGKCVDRDPSDEPAEKLLVRIRADRAVIVPRTERRTRRARGAA